MKAVGLAGQSLSVTIRRKNPVVTNSLQHDLAMYITL